MVRRRNASLGMLIAIAASIVAVRPAVAGGGGCFTTRASSARTTTILLAKFCFGPTLARVPVGAVVTWVNNDNQNHTVTGANNNWGSLGELGMGGRLRVTFKEAGTYPYYCLLHPGMAGAVLVGDANGPGAAADITSDLTTIQRLGDSELVGSTVTPKKAGARTSRWLFLAIALSTGLVGFGVGIRTRNGNVRRTYVPDA
jgi:plastocyanin